MSSPPTRTLWHLLEPVHAVVYFAPEPRAAYADVGLKGGWMGYFASRSAAMGPVPASVVTATFFNFHPTMVARSIPDAWALSTPERVLAARLTGVDAALRRLLGDDVGGEHVRRAAELAGRALTACDVAGRPLFAAHVAHPTPGEPHLALWHRLTCLREHRGDGHVSVLVAAGVDGCEANVLQVAAGGLSAQMQQDYRGWSAPEWGSATNRLTDEGFLDADGRLTDKGGALMDDVERRTDALAAAPYRKLGAVGCAELTAALRPLTRAVLADGAMPFPNPMALPQPEL
ncbi:MAG TPA: hypothetical protein VNA14_03305 [Mycobacteriales bacterium]|nr:hypothetical protein [Mycobacteriales bacterium]